MWVHNSWVKLITSWIACILKLDSENNTEIENTFQHKYVYQYKQSKQYNQQHGQSNQKQYN